MARLPQKSAWMRCLWFWLVLGVMTLGSHGCAWLAPPPEDDPLARQLLENWSRHNRDLPAFKGMMRIQMEEGGRVTSGRAAWAAAPPDRLRLEWLSPLGQPLLSFAGDGRMITLYVSAEQKFHRFKQSRNALERMIGMPIGIEDLVDTLAGRPPLPAHAAARMVNGQGCDVVLENRWHVPVAKLHSEKCAHLESMTAFDTEGRALYQIQWLDWQAGPVDLLPRQIRLTSGAGDALTMILERYWIDTALPPDTFVIAPPQSQ